MKTKPLTETCSITTGKLDANAAVENGDYPFFTCAPDPLRIDSFAYEGDVILLAGNNAQGNFHLRRYCGKFNAYQRTYILTANPGYDIDYIKYSLELSLQHLKRVAQGSQTKFLTMPILESFQVVDIPYTDQQSRISSIREIDKKIELNQKLCAELESVAKTLYDYWFVQFDFPDENGKPYRASGGKMVWNEQLKREIPEGWDVGDLSDIANITMGQSPEGTSYNENGIGKVFYQGRTDFGTRFPTPRMYTTAPTRFAKKNDILLSVRAPVGDLNVAMEECCIGRGLAALNSKLGSQLHLMYTLMGFKKFFDVMDGNGTTFGSITKDDLFELKVAIPPAPLLKRFEEAVSPTENRIRTSETENRELAHLRDWLLPMLMNGQATVMDETPAEQVLSFPQKQPQQFTVKQAARSYSPNEEHKDDTAALLRFYMERKK